MEWLRNLLSWITRASETGNWDTAGPSDDEHPLAPGMDVLKANWGGTNALGSHGFLNGFYTGATRVDAHPGRIGATIVPRTVVVHTTDCLPGTAPVIVKSWSTTRGAGNGAHFVIDRRGGITQLVSVTRNGQHAGGPTHGWYILDQPGKGVAPLVHPNAWAVGIELDCAGKLRAPKVRGGNPVHHDSGKEIPREDCRIHSDGTWWHVITLAQEVALRALLRDLVDQVLKPEPAGASISPSGSYLGTAHSRTYQGNGSPWALHGGPVHGHVTLDPINKTDPGPFVMAKLTEWGH